MRGMMRSGGLLMEIEALWADISAAADHTVLHALREQIHDIADRLPPEMEG